MSPDQFRGFLLRKNILAVDNQLRSVFGSLSTIIKYLEIISYILTFFTHIKDHHLVTTGGHLWNDLLWVTTYDHFLVTTVEAHLFPVGIMNCIAHNTTPCSTNMVTKLPT